MFNVGQKVSNTVDDMKNALGTTPSKDVQRAMEPIKTGGAFMIEQGGKVLPLAVKIMALPAHGISYAIQKGIMKKPDYDGKPITAASDWLGSQLYKIPKSIAKGIRGK